QLDVVHGCAEREQRDRASELRAALRLAIGARGCTERIEVRHERDVLILLRRRGIARAGGGERNAHDTRNELPGWNAMREQRPKIPNQHGHVSCGGVQELPVVPYRAAYPAFAHRFPAPASRPAPAARS